MTERHLLGISGGKDSAALAIYMSTHHPELDIEYFFTDTGKELPEVYEFLTLSSNTLVYPCDEAIAFSRMDPTDACSRGARL